MVDIKNKKERNRLRAEKREKLTNWFMINMSWAFAGLIILQLIGNGYNMSTTLMHMNLWLRIAAGIFVLGGGALIFLWVKGDKKVERFKNYSIFLWVVAAIAVIISYYAPIRNVLMKIPIAPFSAMISKMNSGWRIWFFMSAMGVYLVGAFVYYLIKMKKIK